jgi:TetR/AcrR family transcriptional regulator
MASSDRTDAPLGARESAPAEVPVTRSTARDAVATKARILRIAGTEFARHGFDGTRIDEIAKKSKVSKNLIYHYFQSKDDLFIAVLERAYVLLRNRQDSIDLEQGKPLESIRRLVVETFKFWSQSRGLIAYMDSANFHKAKHIQKSAKIQQAHASLIAKMADTLQQGARAGIFRANVDPIDLYISISALAYHFFSFQRTFSIIFGKDFKAEDVIVRRLKHVEDTVLGYLQFKP